jgi:hypothetical protein
MTTVLQKLKRVAQMEGAGADFSKRTDAKKPLTRRHGAAQLRRFFMADATSFGATQPHTDTTAQPAQGDPS